MSTSRKSAPRGSQLLAQIRTTPRSARTSAGGGDRCSPPEPGLLTLESTSRGCRAVARIAGSVAAMRLIAIPTTIANATVQRDNEIVEAGLIVSCSETVEKKTRNHRDSSI